jgi:hypothetical protein
MPFESVDAYKLVNVKSPEPDTESDCVVGTPKGAVVFVLVRVGVVVVDRTVFPVEDWDDWVVVGFCSGEVVLVALVVSIEEE